MIKKKGIYIERMPYDNQFTIVYYDGSYLLIVVVNKDPSVQVLYEKYYVKFDEKTTITNIVRMWCPHGVNYICDNVDDFPILDLKSILRWCINETNERNN